MDQRHKGADIKSNLSYKYLLENPCSKLKTERIDAGEPSKKIESKTKGIRAIPKTNIYCKQILSKHIPDRGDSTINKTQDIVVRKLNDNIDNTNNKKTKTVLHSLLKVPLHKSRLEQINCSGNYEKEDKTANNVSQIKSTNSMCMHDEVNLREGNKHAPNNFETKKFSNNSVKNASSNKFKLNYKTLAAPNNNADTNKYSIFCKSTNNIINQTSSKVKRNVPKTEGLYGNDRNIKVSSNLISVKESIEDRNNPIRKKEIPIENFGRSGTESNKNGKLPEKAVNRKLLQKKEEIKIESKDVTSTNKKQSPQKSIQIKIPINAYSKKTRIPKLITINYNKNEYSNKGSIETPKPALKRQQKFIHRKRWFNKRILSPVSPVKEVESPSTEVAKWAPNSINKHTKLYYEAWVDTTLTAVSKTKNGMLNLDKQQLLKTFQSCIAERNKSPELMSEDYTDKRFIGRIKINHR